MEDNPYTVMVGAMRKAGQDGRPTVFRLGTVMSLAPLTIQAGDIPLTGGDLLVNADLLPRTRPAVLTGTAALTTLTGTLTGTDAEGAVELSVSDGGLIGEETITGTLVEQVGTLAIGDRVVLLTTDDQLHIVLCKVVEV